jgi:hypothetical protein
MAILDLQKRLVEVGRIRLGMKKVSQNGKSYPARLEQFRLTSRDKQRLDAAAVLYGGEVKKWGEEWELFTETDVLPVAVVPGQALNQSYELWGQKDLRGGKKSAVICLRRCDGITEALSGGGCICANEDEMTCKPTTRLSVVLTEVPGLGVWRCEAHGWNAAMELAGGVQLLESLVAVGRPVRARLRLDKREKKTETETRNFVVPVIDIDHTLGQVLDALGSGPGAPMLEQAAPVAIEATGSFTPVPAQAIESGGGPSVAEQIAQPLARSPRSNGAEPIRSTGRRSRARAEVVGAGTAASSTGGGSVAGGSSPGSPPGSPGGGPTSGEDVVDVPPANAGDGNGEAGDDTTSPPAEAGSSAAASPPGSPTATARAKRVAIACRDAGIESDDDRHDFIGVVTSGRARSGKDLDDTDFALVLEVAGRVKDGRVTVRRSDIDSTLLVEESTAGAGSDDEGWWTKAQWIALARRYVGTDGKVLTQVKCMRQVKAIAQGLGLPVPSDLGEWTDARISEQLRAWIEGHEGGS